MLRLQLSAREIVFDGFNMRRTKKSASSTRQDEESPAKKPRRDPKLRPFATVYFEELVAKAGLVLAEETSNHVLKCEPLAFLDELKSILENNVDFPRNVDEFVKGLSSKTDYNPFTYISLFCIIF